LNGDVRHDGLGSVPRPVIESDLLLCLPDGSRFSGGRKDLARGSFCLCRGRALFVCDD